MADHEEPPYWADRPAAKPFNAEVNNRDGKQTMALNIGNCGISLFRRRPELDYLAVRHSDESWTFMFDHHPLVYWMGGVALGREEQHTLRLMERTNGRFADRYKWNPIVSIEDYPSQSEIDVYIRHLSERDLHNELEQKLKEDLEGE